MVREILDLLCKCVLGCLVSFHVNVLITIKVEGRKTVYVLLQKGLLVLVQIKDLCSRTILASWQGCYQWCSVHKSSRQCAYAKDLLAYVHLHNFIQDYSSDNHQAVRKQTAEASIADRQKSTERCVSADLAPQALWLLWGGAQTDSQIAYKAVG